MTEEILCIDEVVLVRWRAMTAPGVARVFDVLHEVCARDVVPVFIGLVGDGVAPPSKEANTALTSAIDQARRCCSSVNLVLDGTSLTSAAIRSGATAMFLLKGDRRTKMYKSLQDALVDRVRERADAILAAAREAGLAPSPHLRSA